MQRKEKQAKKILTYINGKGLEWNSRADFFPTPLARLLHVSTHIQNLWTQEKKACYILFHSIMICRNKLPFCRCVARVNGILTVSDS